MFLTSHQIKMLLFWGRPLIIPTSTIHPEVHYLNKGGDGNARATLMHEPASVLLSTEKAVRITNQRSDKLLLSHFLLLRAGCATKRCASASQFIDLAAASVLPHQDSFHTAASGFGLFYSALSSL